MKTYNWLLYVVVALVLQACTSKTEQTGSDEVTAEPPVEAPTPIVAPADAFAAAISSIPGRPAEDAARDAGRKPAEVLAFLGLEPGMTVMDVLAAGGWYSEVLSAAVGPNGKVIIQNPPQMFEVADGIYGTQLAARLEGGRLKNIERIDANIDELDLAAGSLDFAMTALNFHDIYYLVSPEAAAGTLAVVHSLLKPGGVFGVIDHYGASDADNAALHRIDPEIFKRMATDAGFVVEAQSGILHNHHDDMTQMVFSPDVVGKTHRFVVRLRKP